MKVRTMTAGMFLKWIFSNSCLTFYCCQCLSCLCGHYIISTWESCQTLHFIKTCLLKSNMSSAIKVKWVFQGHFTMSGIWLDLYLLTYFSITCFSMTWLTYVGRIMVNLMVKDTSLECRGRQYGWLHSSLELLSHLSSMGAF